MKHTQKTHQKKQFRNAFLVLGLVCMISGATKGLAGDITGQGSLAIQQTQEATFEQGFSVHPAANEAATSAGLIALGSLLFFLSFGFHALVRSPHDRHVPVRKAPSYKSTPLHRKRRTREVIWIEKVIRL